MVRTQIYLERSQKEALERLSAQRGQAMAELIRTAVNRLLEEECTRAQGLSEALNRTFGLWRERTDIQDAEGFVRATRQGWSRRTGRHRA